MRSTLLSLLALLVLSPATSQGALIRVDFAGVVSDVFDGWAGVPGVDPLLDGSIEIGTPFSGSALYEDTQSPFSTDATSARWVFLAPPGSLEISVGNYVLVAGALGAPFTGSGFQIDVQNGSSDSYYMFTNGALTAGEVGGPGELLGVSSGFYVSDSTGSTLDSTVLADVPIALAPWSFSQFEFAVIDDTFTFASVHGSLTSFSATIVPEPTTLALLTLGCAALAAHRKRGAQ